MQYATVYDVAALFKSLATYQTMVQAEMQQRLNEVHREVDNVLRGLYRVPLTLNNQQFKFSTTSTGAVAAGGTTIPLTAVGTVSALDGQPLWLTPGMALYIDPNTSVQERIDVASINLGTNVVTMVSPQGNSTPTPPITLTGFQYAHNSGAVVAVSDSLDILHLVTSRLTTANLIDIYFAASDNSVVNEQAAQFRHYGEMILADIIEGSTQLFDVIPLAEKPIYPVSKGLVGPVAWTGTFGDTNTPAFSKETYNPIVFGESM